MSLVRRNVTHHRRVAHHRGIVRLARKISSQPTKEDVVDNTSLGYDGTKVDIWSACVILYASCTGVYHFD